jgi:hypothetical protein
VAGRKSSENGAFELMGFNVSMVQPTSQPAMRRRKKPSSV